MSAAKKEKTAAKKPLVKQSKPRSEAARLADKPVPPVAVMTGVEEEIIVSPGKKTEIVARPAKPATPQVPAMPGTAPLGIKPTPVVQVTGPGSVSVGDAQRASIAKLEKLLANSEDRVKDLEATVKQYQGLTAKNDADALNRIRVLRSEGWRVQRVSAVTLNVQKEGLASALAPVMDLAGAVPWEVEIPAF